MSQTGSEDDLCGGIDDPPGGQQLLEPRPVFLVLVCESIPPQLPSASCVQNREGLLVCCSTCRSLFKSINAPEPLPLLNIR